MTCSLHRGAEIELADVARFYRREAGRAVAARFLNEFERVTELRATNEGLGTPTGDDRRWFPIYGFPYSIIYRSLQPGIRILAVRHQHRDPAYCEERR